MKSQVAIVKCRDYTPGLVEEAVKTSLGLLGGTSSFIKPESKVLVKPNLLMAISPESGVDTHPEVVRAVIKALKEINCEITVGDGPSVWGIQIEKIDQVYEVSGIKKICDDEGVKLIKLDKRRMREKFPLSAELDNCDYLVNIPKFKTHEFTVLTAAIKNLFGLVTGTFKTELHKKFFQPEDFASILVDIYQEARPALTIVDGIVAMEGDGPATSGKLRNTGLIIAGSDCVAIDSILASIMGINPTMVLTTKEAARRGLGEADIDSISIVGEKLEDVIERPFLLPAASIRRKLPQPVINLAKKLIKYYPCVKQDNCIKCAACIKSCPKKVIRLKNNKIVFDYSGCIACFCCQESCPASAIKVRKSLFAKLIGL